MDHKIIIFGGTFDPVHNGHIGVASHAVEHVGAERLIFVPAKRSPHKNDHALASGQDRLQMIKIAIENLDRRFGASDCELVRDEPSYTIDTVKYFQNEFGPDTQIYLLVGADGLSELPRWHRIKELLDRCNIVLMLRPGFSVPDLHKYDEVFGRERVEKLEKNLLTNPLIDISSTTIRAKLLTDEDVSGLLPPPVLEYIRANKLYTR